MHAIEIEGDGLSWRTVPDPQPAAGEVQIAVHATAVNRADLVQRQGGYPPPPGASPILGLECAGEVTAVGEGVTRVKVGDAVCALLAGGGYAETVVVPAGQVLPVPDGLDYLQAASIPEVFATAYLNLYMEGGLTAGERVLVHAGASGVGTAAIQLCCHSGNPVFITAGSRDKVQACLDLGAAAGHDRHAGSFAEALTEWTAGRGVDVILDPVGASYFSDNLRGLAMDGRLVLIGMLGGLETSVNLGQILMRRLRVIGSTLRARSIPFKSRVMDGLQRDVWPAFAAGRIRPVIDRVFPIQEAAAAHAHMAADENVGKIVLQLR